MPKRTEKQPENLRPYTFHGVELDWYEEDQKVDCPFCGSHSFYVRTDTGVARCWSCNISESGTGMNASSFIRLFHKKMLDMTTDFHREQLRVDRKLVSVDVIRKLELAFDGQHWLIPGYNADLKMTQLYRYADFGQGRIAYPTPGLGAAMFGLNMFNSKIRKVDIVEGVWDLASMAEVYELGLVNRNVIGLPGVTTFKDPWTKLTGGSEVVLWFDNDHPKEDGTLKGGVVGVKFVGSKLSNCQEPPEDLQVLKWGDSGYDLEVESGADVRDVITGKISPEPFENGHSSGLQPISLLNKPETGSSKALGGRLRRFNALRSRLGGLPEEWLQKGKKTRKDKTRECNDFQQVLDAWKACFRWREDLEHVLISMLAVVISTEQLGDQLFLQVIGDAGSGKTRFCDAFLTSPTCHALEHLTGFHSGWKGEDGEDYSLIARIDRKTLITPEGDVLMSSPNFAQIMSQQRRIFDGTSGASFKNQKEDSRYTGLRTPWIIAGTPTLMDSDQSRLGDRFLRVCIATPEHAERRMIQRAVARSALTSVMQTSCAVDKTLTESKMTEAYQLTGGYVSYLRDNAEKLIQRLKVDEEELFEQCMDFGEFGADFRARPNPEEKKESNDTKELPTRLTHQFLRMACCAAASVGETEISKRSWDVTRRVTVDTSKGRTYDIAQTLFAEQDTGLNMKTLYNRVNATESEIRKLIRFMRSIKVVRKVSDSEKSKSGRIKKRGTVSYKLTDRVYKLMTRVLGEDSAGD